MLGKGRRKARTIRRNGGGEISDERKLLRNICHNYKGKRHPVEKRLSKRYVIVSLNALQWGGGGGKKNLKASGKDLKLPRSSNILGDVGGNLAREND